MQKQRFGAPSSSEDPQKLGGTVKGLIIGASVLIIWTAHQLGFEITSEEVTQLAIGIGAAISTNLDPLWAPQEARGALERPLDRSPERPGEDCSGLYTLEDNLAYDRHLYERNGT